MDKRERVARAIYDRSWMYDRTKPWTIAPENEKRLCYAMADAALAEIGGVRVKPLVWAESIAQISYFAKSCVGEYRITKTRNTRNDKWQVNYLDANRRSHVVGYIGGIEAAKAAAQADYEARILAALEPVTVQEAARVLLANMHHCKPHGTHGRPGATVEHIHFGPYALRSLRALAERG